MRKTDTRMGSAAGIGRRRRGPDSGGVRAAARACGVLATGLALLAAVVHLQAAAIVVEGGSSPPPFKFAEFACKVGARTVEVSSRRGSAPQADHPWQVTLSADGRTVCGAVLLGAEWVLTSGYCVAGARPQTLAVGYGVTDLGVSEVHVHPERDPANHKNDLALLRLAGAINARNSYANLPDKDATRALERPGNCAVVTGYGALPGPSRETVRYPLQVANAAILSRKECRAAYGESRISAGEICAGRPRAAATTFGDGGGALTVGGSPNRPRWLVGVVSWGEGQYPAPDAKPDVYMRVAHYREWIERTMAKPSEAAFASRGLLRAAAESPALASETGLDAALSGGDAVVISYAAAPGSPAMDGEDGGNSPYAAALAKHLGTPGLDVNAVLTRVRNEVIEATDGEQAPWHESKLAGAPFYFVPAEGSPAGSRVALVVGNTAYASIGDLKNPGRDAKLVGRALAQAGFDVTAKHDLTGSAFLYALAEFREASRQASAAVFYYAGHGTEGEGVMSLAPVDMRDLIDMHNAIEVEQVIEAMQAQRNVVLLDAMFYDPRWTRRSPQTR